MLWLLMYIHIYTTTDVLVRVDINHEQDYTITINRPNITTYTITIKTYHPLLHPSIQRDLNMFNAS